jgi:hypothetical protein
LAIVAFPTIAVFVTLVLLAYAVVLAMRTTSRAHSWAAWQVGAVVAGGWLVAVVAYYGLYVEPVVASARALLGAESRGGSVRWPGGPGELIGWTADYVVTVIPLLLGIMGLAAYFVVRPARRSGLAFVLLALWMAILPLFMLVNYRMDMIGKHLFFTVLPVAVLGGAALAPLWARRRWGALLTALVVGVVGWQGLLFWVDRLVRAST